LTVANKLHHDRLHAEQDELNGTNKQEEVAAQLSPEPPKLNSGYKQLDISEVLYLIMQQIGFPEKEYWQRLSSAERALFPRHPLVENIRRKGKRSKLFDNDGFEAHRLDTANQEKKMNEQMMMSNGNGHHPQNNGDADDEEESDCSAEEEDEFMPWSSFSEQLQGFRGISWNLFKHYGSNLIETMNLGKMEESLRRMVLWDPKKRITPEQCLEVYFPKVDRYADLYDMNEIDDDF